MITDVVKDFRTEVSLTNSAAAAADRSVSSSVTCLETLSIEHKWTVERFQVHMDLCAVGEALSSPVFGSRDGRYKFNLRLFPTGKDEECRSYVSLFLMIRECPGQKIRFKVQFFVETTDGPKFCALNRHVVAINKGGIVTASKFFAVDFLRGRAQRYLPDDTLTVGVELDIFGDTFSSDVKKDDAKDWNKEVPECSLTNDFARMYRSEMHADCELIVDGCTLRAHKSILAARSPVFEAMFEHKMKEACSSQCIIEDLTVDAMRAVLEFIYTGACTSIEKYAGDILQASDKYQVCRLKAQCEICLTKKIDADNVCDNLKLADRYNAQMLRACVLTFLKQHKDGILYSEGWQKLAHDDKDLANATLCELLMGERKSEKRAATASTFPDQPCIQKRPRFT